MEKKFNLYYDLSTEEFLVPRSMKLLSPHQIPLYQLIDTKAAFSFQTQLIKHNYSEADIATYMERYATLGSQLIDYEIPSINIDGGDVGKAVLIFSRVNSKGADISPDWMISALSYNRNKEFRLGSLINSVILKLEEFNLQNIPNVRDVVLKCITHSFGKPYFDQSNNLINLAHKDNFIDVSQKVAM